MDVRERRRAERAAAFARAQLGVDPALVEEAPRDVGHFWAEIRVGFQHEILRIFERDVAVTTRKRRVAVVIFESIETENLRLQSVVARNEGIVLDAGGEQRVDRAVCDFVGEIAGIHRCAVAAQAVVYGLVLNQRVEDECEWARIGAKPHGECRRSRAARIAIRRVEAREHFLFAEVFGLSIG